MRDKNAARVSIEIEKKCDEKATDMAPAAIMDRNRNRETAQNLSINQQCISSLRQTDRVRRTAWLSAILGGVVSGREVRIVKFMRGPVQAPRDNFRLLM
jgi:hypothetical protein